MDRATILTELTAVFRDVFNDDALTLTPETAADDVEGWDSMKHIVIVAETERRFGLKFRMTEIDELTNVGDFAALIEAKTGRP